METNLHSLYETDSSMELDGIWFQVSETTRFRVRRFGGKNSAKIRKLTALYHKPYARMIDLGTFPEEKEREIYVKIFTESCLVTWEGVVGKDGKEIPFTLQNAVELFKSLPELFDTLTGYASDVASYKVELGNSSNAG